MIAAMSFRSFLRAQQTIGTDKEAVQAAADATKTPDQASPTNGGYSRP